MKISMDWLKDYVDVGLSTEDLAHRLTMAGMEVEAVSRVGKDTVFELEVTPNRADCLSMLGMAREVSAVLNKSLKLPKIGSGKTPAKKISIQIENTQDCQVYFGSLFQGIKMGESPDWLKTRIASVGIRPISNIVDITNFCLMENGQPLHAFDYDKLAGGIIEVRRAKKGEKIVTIDDVERELDPSILVIADAEKPVAIAGIMGGKATEVTASTRNILLESAYFDPIVTRRASRKLGLSSDSSYRFERGVDLAGVWPGAIRATEIIGEFAGGTVTHHGKAGSIKLRKQKQIAIHIDRINTYLGTNLNVNKVKTILKRLNFSITTSKSNSIKITPPSTRKDILSDVDVIEEVARIIGYDNLPETMPSIKTTAIHTNAQWKLRSKLRELMIAQGFDEVISFSLINEGDLIKSKVDVKKKVRITNPLSLEQEILQPATLPSLLDIVKTNINRGQKNLRLFESGKIYLANGEEKETLSIIMTGTQNVDWRQLKKTKLDIYDLKGVVEQTLKRIQVNEPRFVLQNQDCLTAGASIVISIGKKEMGYLGKINADVLDQWNIKTDNVLFAQILIPNIEKKQTTYRPLSNFPAITRDISLAIDQQLTFQKIKDLALDTGGPLLNNITFSEEYLGEKILPGQRGIIFSLTYQSEKGTLTEDEVNALHQKVLKKITETFQVTIR